MIELIFSRRPTAAFFLACGMLFGTLTAAGAADLDRTVTFNIDAQPLETALVAFSQQADIQVVLNTGPMESTEAPALKGTVSARAGLSELLKDSGFRYATIGERTVSVMRAHGGSDGQAIRTAAVDEQSATAAQGNPETAGAGSGEPAATAGEEGLEESLAEIVVTAQKRLERVQDVPISIAVLGGRDLDKFTGEGVSEALTLVPGVQIIKSTTGGTQLSVRGVAASGSFYAGSSPIGYYVDSVPFGLVKSAIVPDSNAYDLERIEVLRGPQGTLYGASALNGVVRVLTKNADLNSFEVKGRTSGSATASGGENYRGDLAVNVPIIDGKLAVRAVAGYEHLDGWIDNLVKEDANDALIRNGRVKINAQPTDNLSIVLTAWLSRSDYGALSIGQGVYHGRLDQPVQSDYDVFGMTVGYTFPAFTVTSSTSYIDYSHLSSLDIGPFDQEFPFDADFVSHTDFRSKVFSEEVLVNSARSDAWRWSLGGFYRDARDNLLQDVFTDLDDTSQSFAAFGELTRILLDGKLELTGGLRYFEDEVEQQEQVPAPPAAPTDPLLPPVKDTFSKTTPRAVITWHANDDTNLYASYAEGFRSGWNQSTLTTRLAPGIPPVQADSLKNYELGAKGGVLGGNLSYEVAVYYIDWQDIQQQLLIDNGAGAFAVSGVNGQAASGIGVDLALIARPVKGFELGASFSWNDLTLDKDVLASFDGTTGTVIFDEGQRLNYSPKYTAGGSAAYVFPLGELEGRLAVSGNYYADQTVTAQTGPTSVSLFPSDDIFIGRANFALGSPGRWQASLFVDNFNDEKGKTEGSVLPDFEPHLRPRTVGLQLEYFFAR